MISDAEIWLSAFLQLSSYCLKNPQRGLVKAGALRKDQWTELLERVRHDPSFSYFVHSIEFCLLKLGLKYLSLDMPDEALHLAFKMENNAALLAAARQYARKKKNVMLVNLMDYHRQKSQPGAQSPLVKSMVHLANFSAKQLRKEDYNNLYKDFDTLLKIDDINDLDLSDFNGWDIDLAKY